MDEKALRTWVGDNLHALLGLSEINLTHFVISQGAERRILM